MALDRCQNASFHQNKNNLQVIVSKFPKTKPLIIDLFKTIFFTSLSFFDTQDSLIINIQYKYKMFAEFENMIKGKINAIK